MSQVAICCAELRVAVIIPLWRQNVHINQAKPKEETLTVLNPE
jgi:hypothetical protein